MLQRDGRWKNSANWKINARLNMYAVIALAGCLRLQAEQKEDSSIDATACWSLDSLDNVSR